MNFSIKKAYLWLSLRDFQFHLKGNIMLSLLLIGFLPEFPSSFVFLEFVPIFCLIIAYSAPPSSTAHFYIELRGKLLRYTQPSF